LIIGDSIIQRIEVPSIRLLIIQLEFVRQIELLISVHIRDDALKKVLLLHCIRNFTDSIDQITGCSCIDAFSITRTRNGRKIIRLAISIPIVHIIEVSIVGVNITWTATDCFCRGYWDIIVQKGAHTIGSVALILHKILTRLDDWNGDVLGSWETVGNPFPRTCAARISEIFVRK